jgi:hypothetical protein
MAEQINLNMAPKPTIHAMNIHSDYCACGYYRMFFPANCLKTMMNGKYSFKFTETEYPIFDSRFYIAKDLVKVIRFQRWFEPWHAKAMKEFYRPLADKHGIWLVYEIDDVLSYEDIPQYNLAREHFNPNRIGDSVKEILSLVDMLTVTTDEMKDLYHRKYNVPLNKIMVIPNYLPRWWIGDSFNFDKRLKQWDLQHHKPNIAFCCSINHFDINNVNNGVDDFTHLIPWIRNNLNKYNFTFVGGVPQQLIDLAKSHKIFYQPPSDIFNYSRELGLRKIDLLVAPLVDNEFNRCKSNIKWLEFSALGIPMLGQNICTYNKYTDQVFDTSDDIDNWCEKIFFGRGAKEKYADIILKNRQIIEGNENNNGWWLEKNIKQYYDLYSITQKTVSVSI